MLAVTLGRQVLLETPVMLVLQATPETTVRVAREARQATRERKVTQATPVIMAPEVRAVQRATPVMQEALATPEELVTQAGAVVAVVAVQLPHWLLPAISP